jgi:hypothetical protein
MKFINVLRAKITSLAVAARWSCAIAAKLVARTAAASPAHARAARRRRADDLPSRPVTFRLLADAGTTAGHASIAVVAEDR